MKKPSRIILETLGWELTGSFPNIKKSVVVLAPHTSNWDFIIGRLYLNAMGIESNTLMKKEMFFFPFNVIMSKLGAIPVERGNTNLSQVSQLKSIFDDKEELNLFIAPEGTRKKVSRWKKGFFHISKEAKVPIVLSYIDYKKKTVGIAGLVNDPKNLENTMGEISAFYTNINAKHPENFLTDKEYN